MSEHTFRITGKVMLAVCFCAVIVLTGCDNQGPAEQAGENIDETIENVGDALDDAGEKTEDAIDELNDENKN